VRQHVAPRHHVPATPRQSADPNTMACHWWGPSSASTWKNQSKLLKFIAYDSIRPLRNPERPPVRAPPATPSACRGLVRPTPGAAHRPLGLPATANPVLGLGGAGAAASVRPPMSDTLGAYLAAPPLPQVKRAHQIYAPVGESFRGILPHHGPPRSRPTALTPITVGIRLSFLARSRPHDAVHGVRPALTPDSVFRPTRGALAQYLRVSRAKASDTKELPLLPRALVCVCLSGESRRIPASLKNPKPH
jgi:hypothetical protein